MAKKACQIILSLAITNLVVATRRTVTRQPAGDCHDLLAKNVSDH
jgi:hypothetical protein